VTRGATRWALAVALAAGGGLLGPPGGHAQEAVGRWHGALSVNPALPPLRIEVQIQAGAGGGLSGDLVSLDQTPKPIPLAEVSASGGSLSFATPQIGGRYAGRWDPQRNAWVGTWTQGPASLPLTLEAGPAALQARPQTPKPPFPYRTEEIAVASAPGVRLAGTLTIPRGRGPFPAAVMITGSGPQDRDETIFGHKPFAVIADALTHRGVAVLRLDDRGVGGSTGVYAQATTADLAGDVEAAVKYLRGRADVDAARIGLIGHSEGGIIGPEVAAADPAIAFVVMLAGPGVPMGEVLRAQRDAISRSMGLPPATIAANDKLSEAAIAAAVGADGPAEAAARVRATLAKAAPTLPKAAADQMAAQLSTNDMRTLLAIDPRPALERLRMPVLALIGSKDMQVPADQNIPALREDLKADPKATVEELPGLNHLFQTAPTGSPKEYAQIEETIAPSALARITNWVVKVARR
jgi:pimeloyl-ACP methyl ester carboxylesterase